MNNVSLVRRAALVASATLLVAACGMDDPATSGRIGGGADGSGGARSAGQGGAIEAPPVEANRDSARAPSAQPPPVSNNMPQLVARAQMMPVGDGTARGTIEFGAAGAGPLTLNVMLMGLEAGAHGIHVHAGTDCAAPGEHFDPASAQHGPPTAEGAARHRGDLGNVMADASGVVQETLQDSVLASDQSYIGKVIVVHSRPDDLMSQPSGGSGDPIACGVIEGAGINLSQSPGENRGV